MLHNSSDGREKAIAAIAQRRSSRATHVTPNCAREISLIIADSPNTFLENTPTVG
jgi:hypothetical protein